MPIVLLLHFFCSFCAVCSVFVSHGIRQRNSSVPLRELVDISRATALIAPIQGPAGRQAIFGIEECPYCDPKKCLNARPAGAIGLCLSIRDGGGLLLSSQCVVSRKELNRAMAVRHMPPTARNRRQGCERSEAEEGDAEEMAEELCWCETAQHRKSLLEEGLAIPNRASSIQHARRRKNHPGMPTSHQRQSVDKGGTEGQKEHHEQQRQLPYQEKEQQQSQSGTVKRKQSDRRKNGTGDGRATPGHPLIISMAFLISCCCCWTKRVW